MNRRQLEMAYTSYADSCKDPHLDSSGTVRFCRRPKGHDPDEPHASDMPYVEWMDQ